MTRGVGGSAKGIDMTPKMAKFFFVFFFKFLADTCPFWGHWYPCFGFLVMSSLGFKARVAKLK